MQINYDAYGRPTPVKVYLGTPSNKILCALNGIDENSFTIEKNTNNTSTLSFDVNRYLCVNGVEIESNAYNLLGILMRLYVENYGWFLMSPPVISGDGVKEIASITAESAEIEMQQHDIKSLRINYGTTDSYEMLVDGNVEMVGEVEFAKKNIKFCDKTNTELSLLHILLDVSGLKGWTIGYVDEIPKTYKYYESGQIKTRTTLLSDEIGYFDIESQDLYSLLTQEIAQYFECVFVFDNTNFTISAYRPENLGKDTNINIGFRNIQNTNEISIDDTNIFTRYYVQGSDALGITYVNFGDNYIENLSYFMNERYMSADLIDKYKRWLDDVEVSRPQYIENTRQYNSYQATISELYNRLPLDDCSTDWSTFTDEELLEAKSNYEAQIAGFQSYYVDDNNQFDQVALDASSDASTYYQILNVILPSIEIEIQNRNLGEENEYIDTYETDWDLYGLYELDAKLKVYKNTIKLCEANGYNLPYDETTAVHTQEYHTKMYEKYCDAVNNVNPDFIGGCMEAYNARLAEINNAKAQQDIYDNARKQIRESIDKTTWKCSSDNSIFFTGSDISELSRLYIDGDYNNENMFLVSSDDSVTAIDEQLKLLSAAEDDLSAASQPQYTYTTTLDNFLAKSDYSDYAKGFDVSDYIYLGVRDDYVVKLRAVSVSFNPMTFDNNLSITFSNMVKSRAGRNDISYLINSSGGGSKNTATGAGGDYLNNEGVVLSAALIQKLVANGSFSSSVSTIVENELAGYVGSSMSIEELNSKMIRVTDIVGENGFFEYLQAKLLVADKVVAESAEFQELQALVAQIDTLLAGTVSAELGHVIKLTADNVTIDEAVIRDLIAANIMVSDLKAGSINTDVMNIESEDGLLSIVGNTIQIKDSNNNVRMQIGHDAANNFTFTLYDETGSGVLIDSTGIKESAIGDGIIKNNMIQDGTITKSKMGFNIVDTDENGNIDASNVMIDGHGISAEFTSIRNEINNIALTPGQASISIVLGSDAQNIPCDSLGNVGDGFVIQIPFYGYYGVAMTDCSVTVGVCPPGMSVGTVTSCTNTTAGMIEFVVASGTNLGGTDRGTIDLTFTIQEKQLVKKWSWSKAKNGTSRTYILEPSTLVMKKGEDNVLSPSSVTFTCYYADGSAAQRHNYDGLLTISESTDGTSFSSKYVSSSAEHSKEWIPTTSSVRAIRCILSSHDSIANQLAVHTVVILTDIDNIGPELEEIRTSVTGVSSRVDAVETSITNKVWSSDITEAINTYDGSTVSSLRDTVSSHTTSIAGIEANVSTVQSTLEQKADGSQVQTLIENIGEYVLNDESFTVSMSETYMQKADMKSSSRNLLRNSKTLIFDNYYISDDTRSMFVDAGGNRLTDANGNILVI